MMGGRVELGSRPILSGQQSGPARGRSGDAEAGRIWAAAQIRVEERIGQAAFQNWIAPLGFAGVSDRVARFEVPTGFFGTYVGRAYGDSLLSALLECGCEADRLDFVVAGKGAGSRRTGGTARRVAQPESDTPREVPGAPLDPRCTFENFVVGKPNELAYEAARRVAEGGPVAFNPLFLYGGVGLGKTHLMQAIAWARQASKPDGRVIYISAEQFMYRFVAALRSRDVFNFKEVFRSVDMLLIDDVQFIANKESTQDEFFHTFNTLIDNSKQLVISGDRAPGEIDGLEERIKSRLHWGLAVDLHPTDYELRLGILQSKAEQQLAHYRDVDLRPGVLEFLAHRINSNVRVLEGALTRLFAHASLVGGPIDLDLTHSCLADTLRASERKVTVEEILRKVAEHYRLRLSDLTSGRRERSVARPRQVAMYLAKTLTSRSLPEIGRQIGGRDHSTVIHGVRRIEELKRSDARIAEDVELLRRMLEA